MPKLAQTLITDYGDHSFHITVEIGRTTETLDYWQKLKIGDRFELPNEVNQPIAIYINDRLAGWGRVVIIGESKFGVQLVQWAVPDAPPDAFT